MDPRKLLEKAVKAAWAEEIARRLDELTSGRVKAIPWETARQQILSVLDETAPR